MNPSFFFLINFTFLLKYSWFTVSWQFLPYSNMTQLYTYRRYFLYSFPLWFITGYWIYFPVLHSRTLLFIHSIYKSLHLLIPASQSFPPLLLPLFSTTSLFSVSLSLLCRYVYLCSILDFTYMWYHIVFVFFFLIYFTLCDNLSIQLPSRFQEVLHTFVPSYLGMMYYALWYYTVLCWTKPQLCK